MKKLLIILSLVMLAGVCISAPRKARRRLQLAASGEFSPLDLNPLVWYKADSNTVDASGNDYTGTWRGSASYTNGVNGQAFNIGSSESAVLSAVAADMNLTAGTICFWAKPNWDNTDSDIHIFFDTYGGSNRRTLLMYYGISLTQIFYTDTVNRGGFSQTIIADEWFFMTIVYGTNEMYINGELVNDYTDGDLGDGASTLYIGDRYTNGDSACYSAIDDFMIFTNVLTTAEIKTVYEWRE